ncbi:hypothetical protein HPB50_002474 [Hyalomma asiaticum]|uniref:Uncharacterized protein n=1 Tax=Hyalomma asiaticum TaxID=266040 RepID=A0ACB7RHC3_HYAAI|nr:hypothetical protein HPB50_002474 [Hyalomma asiaticum]
MATYSSMDVGLVTCPYNPDHKVKRNRLSAHVSICLRQCGRRQRISCPYNKNHDVPSSIYKQHLIDCPDRSYTSVSAASRSDAEDSYVVPLPPRAPTEAAMGVPTAGGAMPTVPEPEEVWEEELVPTTEPCETPSRPFYHEIHGLKGAERRRYYHKFWTNLSPAEQATGMRPQMGIPAPSSTTAPCTMPRFKMGTESSVDEKKLPSAEGHSFYPDTLMLDASWSTCGKALSDQHLTVQVRMTSAGEASGGLPSRPFSILANRHSDDDVSQTLHAQASQIHDAQACQTRGARLHQSRGVLTGEWRGALSRQLRGVQASQPCGAEASQLHGAQTANPEAARAGQSSQHLCTQLPEASAPQRWADRVRPTTRTNGTISVDEIARRLMGLSRDVSSHN